MRSQIFDSLRYGAAGADVILAYAFGFGLCIRDIGISLPAQFVEATRMGRGEGRDGRFGGCLLLWKALRGFEYV